MKNPCKGCPGLRTSRCRDCGERIQYNEFKRLESRWTRRQNDLSSQEECRLRGKLPRAKDALQKESALPVDKTGKGAQQINAVTGYQKERENASVLRPF